MAEKKNTSKKTSTKKTNNKKTTESTKKKKKKKVKLNDKVLKPEKYVSDEAQEAKRFVIILLSIIIIIIIVYAISSYVSDKNTTYEDEVTAGEIDYDKLSIGTLLNRDYNEYYVMIYDAEDTSAILYSAIINNYINSTDAIKIYFCDLGNYFNSSYYVGEDGESNPSAKSIDELALGNLTLIKVKNGKITKYIETLDEIKEELGV